MQNVTLADGTVIRDLASQGELTEAVRLQEQTWGKAFSERVPAAILMVAQKIGGVSAGAFSAEGRLLGFVFGMTGVRDGRLVHWSDMLAVLYWTFDPLVSRNAHLNLNRLGATVEEFVPDMYGADTHSRMLAIGTDRFVVAWPIGTEPVSSPPTLKSSSGAPIFGGASGGAPALDAPLPDAPVVAVRIPQDYHSLVDADIAQARSWRASARRAFLHYLPRGYRVTAFVPHPDATYLLTRNG